MEAVMSDARSHASPPVNSNPGVTAYYQVRAERSSGLALLGSRVRAGERVAI